MNIPEIKTISVKYIIEGYNIKKGIEIYFNNVSNNEMHETNLTVYQICRLIDKHKRYSINYRVGNFDCYNNLILKTTIQNYEYLGTVSSFITLLKEFKLYKNNLEIMQWWNNLDKETKQNYYDKIDSNLIWWWAKPSEIINLYKS